jgi:prolyl-tRNA editing enzyme YbaK/EbsC (Cys-tRNA(Pro) deacylase)
MAKKDKVSETPATALLRQQGVCFTEHPYDYLEHGGAQHSAQVLGMDPFSVVKTLIMQDQDAKPLVQIHAGLHRRNHPGFAAHLYQRRQARLSGRH